MEPEYDSANFRYGIFYVNKNDPRVIVPRALGWTFNFARPVSYVITGTFILALVLAVVLSLLKII